MKTIHLYFQRLWNRNEKFHKLYKLPLLHLGNMRHSSVDYVDDPYIQEDTYNRHWYILDLLKLVYITAREFKVNQSKPIHA